MTVLPEVVLLFSGKRKSGKDYVADLLWRRLGPDVCCVLRLSGPLKEEYARERSLDFGQLLGAGEYKERYRADMIRWGEERREQDPGVFCRLATRGAIQPIWIVSDVRRLSDLQWFWSAFPQRCHCVRVVASEQSRAQRGWSFTAGVDDAQSECGLDQGVQFDWIINNDGDDAHLKGQLEGLLSLAEGRGKQIQNTEN